MLETNNNSFSDRLEAISLTTTTGQKIWRARDLKDFLGIDSWPKFKDAINNAIEAYKSGTTTKGADSHFIQYGGNLVDDYFLSRTACYLVCMSCPYYTSVVRESAVYFTDSTCANELREQLDVLYENNERLRYRDYYDEKHRKYSKSLETCGMIGRDMAEITEAGYVGLYGMTQAELKDKHGIPQNEDYYDYATPAMLFHAAQMKDTTADKINRGEVRTKEEIKYAHELDGEGYRMTFSAFNGGHAPEDTPVEETSIKGVRKAERAIKRQLKKTFESNAIPKESVPVIPFEFKEGWRP